MCLCKNLSAFQYTNGLDLFLVLHLHEIIHDVPVPRWQKISVIFLYSFTCQKPAEKIVKCGEMWWRLLSKTASTSIETEKIYVVQPQHNDNFVGTMLAENQSLRKAWHKWCKWAVSQALQDQMRNEHGWVQVYESREDTEVISTLLTNRGGWYEHYWVPRLNNIPVWCW